MNSLFAKLSAALLARLATRDPLPEPSAPKRGEAVVAAYPAVALKAALARIAAAQKLTAAELARRLRIDPKEARRVLDPREPTKLPRLTEALAATGHAVHVAVAVAGEPAPFAVTPSRRGRTAKPAA